MAIQLNTPPDEVSARHFFEGIFLQAAKLPFIFAITGLLLIGFAHLGNSPWYVVAEKLGNILLTLAVIFFIYRCFTFICKYFEAQLFKSHHVAALVLTSLRKGLRIIFLFVFFIIIINLSEPNDFYLMLADNTLKIIIIAATGWVLIQILYTFEAVLYQSMTKLANTKDHFRAKNIYTKMHIMRNIATVIIVLITIAAILMSFKSVRSIGISLLASAGFLTAIIGLAAQKGLTSIFAGLQIVLSQRIKIGDIVTVDTVSGEVEEISFTYVILKLSDRRRQVIPITFFIDKSFENWSKEPDSVGGTLSIFVDYSLPIDALREELEQILNASAHWDRQTGQLVVATISDRSVEVQIKVSANNADELYYLKSEIKEKMLSFIRSHYPHQFPTVRLSERKQ